MGPRLRGDDGVGCCRSFCCPAVCLFAHAFICYPAAIAGQMLALPVALNGSDRGGNKIRNCHSREGGNPSVSLHLFSTPIWVPAFAGTTGLGVVIFFVTRLKCRILLVRPLESRARCWPCFDTRPKRRVDAGTARQTAPLQS